MLTHMISCLYYALALQICYRHPCDQLSQGRETRTSVAYRTAFQIGTQTSSYTRVTTLLSHEAGPKPSRTTTRLLPLILKRNCSATLCHRTRFPRVRTGTVEPRADQSRFVRMSAKRHLYRYIMYCPLIDDSTERGLILTISLEIADFSKVQQGLRDILIA